MRDFFKSELQTLKAKTGLNQYENLSSMPDGANQLKILFDSMELVCAEFKYIPDDDKKRIVQEQIIRDTEFQGLNSRVLWKWFNARKDHYFKEIAHVPTEHNAEPLTGEERDKRLKEFYEAVMSVGQPKTERVDHYKEIKAQRPVGEKYEPLTKEQLAMKDAHFEYLKAMNKTKLPIKEWPDELEWIEKNLNLGLAPR